MALWGDTKLFFCILFITCCCTVTLAQVPSDCCLSVKDKRIDTGLFADYRHQIGGQGCAIDATILVTRRGRKLCAPANEPWVHKVMTHVDRLKSDCQKNNYMGRRCNGIAKKL
ncbi:C-C motif chemokine 19-like [Mastacembelus armatus]|uniref:C-C motif chemokine 19-like n=1 Tax=Mastacembelus armatus TaxID=205130 RepID=UPI000E45740F|nr:C-C motif chemokine 19-like [Mastacembelus armatus]